jgi:hypothetical protein
MRYLKTYNKLFESSEFATSDELSTIEDILLDIKDLDFRVEIHKNIGGENEELEGESEVCRVYIEKFAVYGFSDEPREVKYYPTDEFVLALQHLISYVDKNYDIEIESICDSQCIDHLSSKSEDGLIENDVRIIGDYKAPIDYIKIIISYKD